MFGRLNVKRLTEIVRVLAKYEFFYILSELRLLKYLPLYKRFKSSYSSDITPVLIRKVLEDLGGAFVKLAQLLALRPDLIGQEYSQEFEKLLLDVPAMKYSKVKEKLKKIPFSDISVKPLGSASISQVHKAKLDDKVVAVKVKKEGVDRIFRDDILIMEFLAKQISKKFNITFVDLNDIVYEFKKYTTNELDLLYEVKNIKKFQENFKGDSNIKIPKVYEEFCSRDVLVMEFVEGKTILESGGHKSDVVIRRISNAVYKMIFEDRFFHADLHPGNIYFKGDKIILLDFGIVGRITKELEGKLFYLFASLVQADLEGVVGALIELNIGDEEVNEEILESGISELLGDYYNVPVKDMDFAKIFYGAIEIARKTHVKMPSQLVLFGKSLITMEGFCHHVNSNFNIVKDAKPYVDRIMKEKFSTSNVINEGKKFGKNFVFEFSKFPKYLRSFFKKFTIIEKQLIKMDNNMESFTEVFRGMIKLLSLTFLFMTFFLSSVFLIDFGVMYKGYSIISLLGFGVSFIILIKVVKYFYVKF